MLHRLISLSAAVACFAPSAIADPPHPQIPTHEPPAKHEEAPAASSMPAAPAPVPPEAVSTLGHALRGTYKCTGEIASPDGSIRKTSARLGVSTGLDGYWITFDVDEHRSKASPYPQKIRIVQTFDAGARAWTSVAIDNRGTLTSSTADHGDELAVTWLGNSHADGDLVRVRAHEERDDKAGTIRLWSEMSRDGQTYLKQYDFECAK
jgi:hypothetical protein